MPEDTFPIVYEDTEMPEDRSVESVARELPPRLAFPVVGIGMSAGGLEALTDFFTHVPPHADMAFVVIPQLSQGEDSLTKETLAQCLHLPVTVAEDGTAVESDHVYVIRPHHAMLIRDGAFRLSDSLDSLSHRRPVDDFFRSLAEEQRERAIAVILGGVGSNGTAGAECIKAVGGLCIAQDPETSAFPAMPRSVVAAGFADFVLRPQEMAEVLIRYTNHPYVQGATLPMDEEGENQQLLTDILAAIRNCLRRDFSGYKKPTLLRRVQRRMGLKQCTDLSEYRNLIRQDLVEATALADDMTIHVTGFFRDPEMWEMLQKEVIIPLMSDPARESVRAWVTACSTGEEAFTLAMLLMEASDLTGRRLDIKIFATDVTERSLAHARAGIYPSGIESDILPARLGRFFDLNDSTFRVKKEIRELVVFAPQNLLHDAPFSRLDICTCRNLLIYLEPEVQSRALSNMHFGLRNGGTLVLGNSETIQGTGGWFEAISQKHRVFRRIGPTRHAILDLHSWRAPEMESPQSAERHRLPEVSITHLAQKALLERFSPPGVVVDREQTIVYFHGDTKAFLNHPPRGEPTHDVILLARPHLKNGLRHALHKAMTGNMSTTVTTGFAESSLSSTRVQITVAPLESRPHPDHFLVTFTEVIEPGLPLPHADEGGDFSAAERHVLQNEIKRVRTELKEAVEELQASNEEMKVSTEEAMSINEELKSTNEEMETSKEELQSLNEELITVNTELRTKMEELEATTSDLSSLLSSTNIAVVFLDTRFRIRRFTPAVKDLLDLIPSDIGRPLSDLAPKFVDPNLITYAKKVLDTLVPLEQEVTSHSSRTYIRRILPYRTTDEKIGGVVITFIDITQLKIVEAALREGEQRHRLVLEGIKDYAIFMLDPAGRITTWNAAAEAMLGYKSSEAIGQLATMILPYSERSRARATWNFDRARAEGSVEEESWYMNKDGRTFWGSGVLSAVTDQSGTILGFVKVVRDNTDRKAAEETLIQAKRSAEVANDAKDHFLANVSHELRTPLSAILLWARHLESTAPPSIEDLRQGLRAIRSSAEQQVELVEDLMDTARIVAGELRLNRRPVSLVEIIDSSVKAIGHEAAQKEVTLAQDLDEEIGTVNLDTHRLHQVISNLLNNALRHTPAGRKIQISAKRVKNEVHISVADEGQGITSDFLPRVFERFDRADRRSIRGKSGLGLGLFITRQLVELHGGKITAHSEGLGKGATFRIVLPSPPVSPASELKPSLPRNKNLLEGMTVLLVEDAPETRAAIAVVLRNEKAEVTPVEHGEAALQLLKNHTYDIIVSDIGLPGINGYEFIQQARKLEKESQVERTPALALTAYTGPDDRGKAMEAGFDRWLAKPVEPGLLTETIADLYIHARE